MRYSLPSFQQATVQRHPSTTRHQRVLPFLVFLASLSFPPTSHKRETRQKEPSLQSVSQGTLTICWQFTLQDLTKVDELIPEMKYRRRTGENSRRPERVEHMGSLTSVSKLSRTVLLARKASTPQSQSG